MITSVNSKMVLVLPDAIEEKTESGFTKPDEVKAKEIKSQNRGIVKVVGSKCEWAKVGDYLSFYRGAGTDIKEEEVSYVLIHEEHCLAKIISNEKK